jgi:hypothetical protein
MRSYIFLTFEGTTFQPGSEAIEPDIENVQMIGIAQGADQEEALENLLAENDYLLFTRFDEVYCYELAEDFGATRREFRISDYRV